METVGVLLNWMSDRLCVCVVIAIINAGEFRGVWWL